METELVDQRSLYWPSFEQPVDCYLVRFVYRLHQNEFSNVAIVGPVTHCFQADLQDLPPDDIYAAYAGWHAESDEITESDVSALTEGLRVDVTRLERFLSDSGYESVEPIKLGSFFGDNVLVASARREGAEGIVVTDRHDICWFAAVASSRPLGPEEAYCIYKGRRLLRSFN